MPRKTRMATPETPASSPPAARRRGARLGGERGIGHRLVAKVAPDVDPHGLQELRGRFAAQTGDHEIVGNGPGRAGRRDVDRRRLHRGDLRRHERPHPPRGPKRLDLLLVERPPPGELGRAMDDPDLRRRLLGQHRRRLQRRIAAAHDQHPLALVLSRIDQPIGHLREIFPGHAQRTGCAAPADRQDHPPRPQDAARRGHQEVVTDPSMDMTLARS